MTVVVREGALDFSALTDREREVLLLLATGEQNRWLARRLGIAERTVRAHTTSIVRKLDLKSRFEAAIVSHLYADDIASDIGSDIGGGGKGDAAGRGV